MLSNKSLFSHIIEHLPASPMHAPVHQEDATAVPTHKGISVNCTFCCSGTISPFIYGLQHLIFHVCLVQVVMPTSPGNHHQQAPSGATPGQQHIPLLSLSYARSKVHLQPIPLSLSIRTNTRALGLISRDQGRHAHPRLAEQRKFPVPDVGMTSALQASA